MAPLVMRAAIDSINEIRWAGGPSISEHVFWIIVVVRWRDSGREGEDVNMLAADGRGERVRRRVVIDSRLRKCEGRRCGDGGVPISDHSSSWSECVSEIS